MLPPSDHSIIASPHWTGAIRTSRVTASQSADAHFPVASNARTHEKGTWGAQPVPGGTDAPVRPSSVPGTVTRVGLDLPNALAFADGLPLEPGPSDGVLTERV